jgi:hypothetical protein
MIIFLMLLGITIAGESYSAIKKPLISEKTSADM